MMKSKWQECPVCVNAPSLVRVCPACNNEHIIHLETGLPPSKHRALRAEVFNHNLGYDPGLYENVNNRIQRMENPPPPPPIKAKQPSHVL